MTERYHIIRLIAKDQLGGTYLAEDKELERQIAFRHFDKGHGSEPEANWEDAFTQYVTKLNALQHPNLIAIHDFDIDDDHPVIITQFIEADTIAQCLQRDALGVIETVNMALDLLTGLQAAHAFGIYHGAMHTGSVKRLALAHGGHHYLIIDLGWKHLSSIVMGEEIHLEDPVLIPPEIFGQTDAANAQSDLFMIGQLCYTALAGGHPFAEHTPEECAAAYQAGKMPPLATFADNIPSKLTDWITSMTMSDPKQRPASAQEAIDALQAIDFSETKVKEQPPSPSPPPTNTNPPPPSFSQATPKAVAIKKTTSWRQKKSVKIAALLIFIVTPAIGLALWYGPMQGGKKSTPTRNNEVIDLADETTEEHSQQTPEKSAASSVDPAKAKTTSKTPQKIVANLLPTKMINTIKNRKKPVIIDLETAQTLDWIITTGAPAAKKHIKKENGECMLTLRPFKGIREFKFPYNPIRFKVGGKKIIPRTATDTKHRAKMGQGWDVDFRIPKNHRGPLIITFYMTQWDCDIDFEVTDQNTKTSTTLKVPCTGNGVVKIPIKIPDAKARSFINIKVLIASMDPKLGCTMGLNGIQVMKP
jgi:serine/threonine protein kinase